MIVHIIDQPVNKLESDVIILHIFDEKRPPRGLTGKVDWMLNGLVSRNLKKRTIKGGDSELVLMTGMKKMATKNILVLGLGTPEKFDVSKLKDVWEKASETLINLKFHKLSVSIPAFPANLQSPEGHALADAMIGGLLDGINKRGGKNTDFHLLLTNFNELKTKSNKDSFRQYVTSLPEVHPIGL